MSNTPYSSRQLSRDHSSRARSRISSDNANDELTQIFNELHINDLFELRDIVRSNQIPIEIKPELQAFFRYRNKTSSIDQQDIITIEIINAVISAKEESKEEEPSPYNKHENGSEVTEDAITMINNNDMDDEATDDGENEFDPFTDAEYIQQCQQDANSNDLSNHKSWNPEASFKATKKPLLNGKAPEFIQGLGPLSAGGNTKLDPIFESKTGTNNNNYKVNIPKSPSTSSMSSNGSISGNNLLSPISQAPSSTTNSPPPSTPPTPMIDINSYLYDIQQLPTPSYWQNTLSVSPQQALSVPVQPIQPIQPLYIVYPTTLPIPANMYIQPPAQSVAMCAMSMPNMMMSVPQTAVSVPMTTNQFAPNMTTQQPSFTNTQATEQKDTEQKHDNYNYGRQYAAPSKKQKFEAKFNNHAKGNFYISKEKIAEMMQKADETFNTDTRNDEKLAFGHYKESVAMSINDKQIDGIFETADGELMIIINIDLHFKSTTDVMYLIAMENAKEFRQRVRWCIIEFMSAQQILYKYGINKNDLPKSSRNMRWFNNGINRAPVNLSQYEIDRILRNTHFKSLPKKTSKRQSKGTDNRNVRKSRISQQNLKYYVEQSLKNDSLPIVPVVVIKGKNQCIEWKRFVEIYDDNDIKQYVGISLKFYDGNKQWKIECMDYDSGRVYYQHRLASLQANDPYNYSYDNISQCITCTLDIYDANRGNYYRHNNRY